MPTDLDPDAAETRARQLLDRRIASVRELVRARQNLTDAREALAAAERDDARLYAAAITDGWTADELRKLGLPEPDRKPVIRRRRTPQPAAPDNVEQNGQHQ